jgi:hypothetical protein
MSLSNSRSGAAGRRGLARAALLLAPLALTACGSVVAGSSSGAAGSPAAPVSARQGALCADKGAVNHLAVTRKGMVTHVQEQRFTFPADVSVTSAAQAQNVAKALCALPPQPTGIVNCPADLGISYQLKFAADGHQPDVVTVASTGCEVVSGAGKLRTTATAPRFWAVLGTAMRLHSPVTQKVFRGVSKAGKHCATASTQMGQAGNCPGKHLPA